MKIKSLRYHTLNVEYDKPEIWAYGEREGSTPLIIEIETDDGIIGYGESRAPFSTLSLRYIIENDIAPLLIDENPFSIERLMKKMYMQAGLELCPDIGVYITSGIEMCLWDIIGKKLNVPLCDLLGGKYRDKVEFGYFLFRSKTYEEMISDAKEAIKQGFRLLKFKVGFSYRDDIEIVKILRQELGDEVMLFPDANQAWAPGTAVKVIREYEKFDVFAVEQPTARHDIQGQIYIRNSVAIPISCNEGIYSTQDAFNLISSGALDILATDICRPGGILQAKKLCGIAEAANIPVIGHSAGELGIAQAAYIHFFASTPGFIYPSDTYHNHLKDNILVNNLQFEGPFIQVPTGPGLGVQLDYDKIRAFSSDNFYNPFDSGEKLLVFPKY